MHDEVKNSANVPQSGTLIFVIFASVFFKLPLMKFGIANPKLNLTNHSGLPQAIVDAVANDTYDKGDADISVTGLLKPPRVAVLEAQHRDEITEDVSDRIWSLLGQSIHTILERANRTAIAERRISMEIAGWKVSGGVDLYQEDGTVLDYKITSVHKLTQGDLSDWNSQLNLYSVLLRHNGFPVSKLQVIALLRDWSKLEARRSKDYPQAQVVNIAIPLWEPDKALAFMRERVSIHQLARVSLPECSAEERWARPDTWAMMKVGRKSAVKLLPKKEDALSAAYSDKNLYVVHRPGESVRCSTYCRAMKFCTQYSNLKQAKEMENSNAIYATN